MPIDNIWHVIGWKHTLIATLNHLHAMQLKEMDVKQKKFKVYIQFSIIAGYFMLVLDRRTNFTLGELDFIAYL